MDLTVETADEIKFRFGAPVRLCKLAFAVSSKMVFFLPETYQTLLGRPRFVKPLADAFASVLGTGGGRGSLRKGIERSKNQR